MALLSRQNTEAVTRAYETDVEALQLLHERPELPPFLEAMAPAIHGFFPGATLTMEWAADAEGGSTYLAVWIETALSLDEADEKLTAFDRSRWRQNRRRAGGRVMVDVRFSDVGARFGVAA